ncbi:MAG: FdtA/QdtA family cupin domain-containing protein [Verrucomicrobiaceae bacterium]|nr:FdtA/QdtA family cupin domain-containing protein [Verrucomicrobiaceae bacterium]
MTPSDHYLSTSVPGAHLVKLLQVPDLGRGDLCVADLAHALPFVPRRCFWVSSPPPGSVRGDHAHRICSQFIFCASGSCLVELDDGSRKAELRLESPGAGLLVPPMVWVKIYQHAPGTVQMVFASHDYDSDDYIRDYEHFIHLHNESTNTPSQL